MTHHTHDSHCNGAAAALAFIVGVGAGVAAGMLFAPQSGEDTRKEIKRKAKDAHEKAKRKVEAEAEHLRQQADDLKDKAKRTAEKVADEGKHLKEDIQRRANEKS